MFLNNAIRNMIRESKTHQIDGIIATSQEEGMISMDNSLLALYRQKCDQQGYRYHLQQQYRADGEKK